MFTGARAFHRASTVETMTAVLQEDPADPLALNPKLPPAAAAIVRRCLEKNKEERFQSARDLAFDLQQLRELTGGPDRSAPRRRPPPQNAAGDPRRRRAGAGMALAVLLSRPPGAPSSSS